jgi:hypothetical protein
VIIGLFGTKIIASGEAETPAGHRRCGVKIAAKERTMKDRVEIFGKDT